METIKANFLIQVVTKPTKGDVMLDLLLKKNPKQNSNMEKWRQPFLQRLWSVRSLTAHAVKQPDYLELYQQLSQQAKRRDPFPLLSTLKTFWLPTMTTLTHLRASEYRGPLRWSGGWSNRTHKEHPLRPGFIQPKEGEGRFTAAYDYLMQACSEDGARPFPDVQRDKMRSNEHWLHHRKFQLSVLKNIFI